MLLAFSSLSLSRTRGQSSFLQLSPVAVVANVLHEYFLQNQLLHYYNQQFLHGFKSYSVSSLVMFDDRTVRTM